MKAQKTKKKRRIEQIPDTPENVAKALFGIKPSKNNDKSNLQKRQKETYSE